MALFGKRDTEHTDLNEVIENIVSLASLRFSVHGIPVTVAEGTAGVDTAVVSDAGDRYELRPLIGKALAAGAGSDEFYTVIMGWVDAVATGEQSAAPVEPVVDAGETVELQRLAPEERAEVEADTTTDAPVVTEAPADAAPQPTAALTDEDVAERLRVRLVPESLAQALGIAYAQPVAPGLVSVLCLDLPDDIAYVSDAQVEGRELRELFNQGFRAVVAEPLPDVAEISPGIYALTGDSFFTATKAIALGWVAANLLPEAPHGVVFGVPHRHVIFAHVLGADSAGALGTLAGIVATQAQQDAFGGAISASTYFFQDDVIERIAFPDDEGTIQVHVVEGDRFHQAMERALAS